MNKTFVADLENHSVYLISNNYISFFVNISKEKETTNITLDLKTKKKKELTKLISYYEKIDNYNITLVIPIIEINENFDTFKTQSNLISLFINTAYRFLVSNGISVRNNINIIKNRSSRSDFVDFFINQFSSRVRHIQLDDLVHEEVPYNKLDAANISFVIGKPELELTIKDDEMKEIIKETQDLVETDKKATNLTNLLLSTTGYISYYLLGFLTAVVTLLFLTLIIK